MHVYLQILESNACVQHSAAQSKQSHGNAPPYLRAWFLLHEKCILLEVHC